MKSIINILFLLLVTSSCSNFKYNLEYQNRSLASGATAKSCSDLLSSLIKETYYDEAAAASLKVIFEELTTLNPELVAGARAPGWQEVEDLKSLLAKFEDIESKYKFPTEQDRVDFFERVFAEHFLENDAFKAIKEKSEEIVPITEFKPTEYDLILNYRNIFERINSFLPRVSRINLNKIANNDDVEKIIKEAEGVYDQQVSRMSDLFRTTGFDSYEDYLRFLKENKEKIGNEIVDTILDEDIEFVMRRPERGRWWIQRTGFHNQHVTGSSRGYMGNGERNRGESALIGVKQSEYENVNNDLKPKYGSIQVSDRAKAQRSDNSKQYGSDKYTFKKEKIKKRLTWTDGDSLAFAWSVDELKEVNFWDQMFIPWDFRGLLLPYLVGQGGLHGPNLNLAKINKDLFPTLAESPVHNIYKNYLEMQVWGPLRFSDIETFEFSNIKPSGDFLDDLIAHKIKIFDGRHNPPVEWTPPKSEVEIEQVIVSTRKPISDGVDKDVKDETEVFDFKIYLPPKGQLKPIDRGFGEGELAGSTKPKWYVDEDGVEWLLKEDVRHKELQTSAEVISSSIYRKLGFNAPNTHIVSLDGKRYAAVRSLGKDLEASSLEQNQSKQWKLAYFVGALLKDNDRIYSAKNNFDLGDGNFALFDFGGTLGSKARGEHKEMWPGWSKHSDAVGTFENTKDIEVIFGWFKDRFKPEGHAWSNVTKEDALEAVELLKTLSDSDIESTVKMAWYSNLSDESYMIEALKNRRDGMIERLLTYFP
jgi:hypothetical protein